MLIGEIWLRSIILQRFQDFQELFKGVKEKPLSRIKGSDSKFALS